MKANDMSESELHKAAHKMREQGGSFAAAIANAYFFADKDNTERLLKAFMHLFERFAPTEENAHE